MTIRELTRRTAFRTAAMFATLFLVAASTIFGILYFKISNDIVQKLKSEIGEIRNTLAAVGKENGFDALKVIIEGKAPPLPDDESVYILTDTDGHYVAGNVLTQPRFNDWKRLPWDAFTFKSSADEYAGTDSVLASWAPVDGGFLLVGTGDSDVQDTQTLLLDGLLGSLGITLFSALLGGAWLGSRTQRRIDDMQRALSAVSRGELKTRIPVSASGDDLDQVARQMNSTLDHLQTAVVTLGQVSTDIAHDLKTPIGRISQRLNIARRTATTVEAYQVAVDETRVELDGVVATFEALLRIAQIESRVRKARFTRVDLNGILSKVVEAYEYGAEDAQQRIGLALPNEIASISGDSDLLVQLFANLVENSIQHSPPGSSITVGLATSNNEATATVSDNGPGIPTAERDNVFQRLYRLQKSRTTPGNGLGLSLVAAIAGLHDAKIELSDNGPGLTVVIKFPKALSEPTKL
jgi:signal transduction histidine kinase